MLSYTIVFQLGSAVHLHLECKGMSLQWSSPVLRGEKLLPCTFYARRIEKHSSRGPEIDPRFDGASFNRLCCRNPNHSFDPRSKNSGPTWPLHTPARREYLELNSRFLTSGTESLDGRGRSRSLSSVGGLSKAVGRGPRVSECAFWREYLPDLITFRDTGKTI